MTTTTFSNQRTLKIKDLLRKLVNSHFSNTLGLEDDIVNIVNALVLLESSYNVNAVGPPVSYRPRTGGASYLGSSAISSALVGASPTQVSNIWEGIYGTGLMQVMGWNFVRGAAPSGMCELERLRPDIAGDLLVSPGDSIRAAILGEANMEKALKAGLIMLEGKYRAVSTGPGYFYFKQDAYGRRFNSKIQAAVAAYLGLGAKDGNNVTPEEYANRIVGGQVYAKANGKDSFKVSDSVVQVASVGPSTNGIGIAKISTAGCA